MSFEPNRLLNFDNVSLLAELRRVAGLHRAGALTRAAFRTLSRVSPSAIVRRFGGWREALEAAGIGHLYAGRRISSKMRTRPARLMSDAEIVSEIKAVAAHLGDGSLTQEALNDHSKLLNAKVVMSRFGSWAAALRAAGLTISPLGRRYSEDQYFENLLVVWTHLGRQPLMREMDSRPSLIPGGAYEVHWKGWRRALRAFLDRVNSAADPAVSIAHDDPIQIENCIPRGEHRVSRRPLSLAVRYRVLCRDGFRCVTCGRSPAVTLGVELEVDHIVPVSVGGADDVSNLRTLCRECNAGKSNRHP